MPLTATTRWQGIRIGIGLAALAWPTARAAPPSMARIPRSCGCGRTGSFAVQPRRGAGMGCRRGRAAGRIRSVRGRNRRTTASRARASSGVSVWSRPQPQSSATIAPSCSETVRSPIGLCSDSWGKPDVLPLRAFPPWTGGWQTGGRDGVKSAARPVRSPAVGGRQIGIGESWPAARLPLLTGAAEVGPAKGDEKGDDFPSLESPPRFHGTAGGDPATPFASEGGGSGGRSRSKLRR